MADDLLLRGAKYISARRAAEITGYERDYVGQLCRLGKVECNFVGRGWFVSEKSLLKHESLNAPEHKKGKISAPISLRETPARVANTVTSSPKILTSGAERLGGFFRSISFSADALASACVIFLVVVGAYLYTNPVSAEKFVKAFENSVRTTTHFAATFSAQIKDFNAGDSAVSEKPLVAQPKTSLLKKVANVPVSFKNFLQTLSHNIDDGKKKLGARFSSFFSEKKNVTFSFTSQEIQKEIARADQVTSISSWGQFANIFEGARQVINSASQSLYKGVNTFVYEFLYGDIEVPTYVINLTPSKTGAPPPSTVIVKETTVIKPQKPSVASAVNKGGSLDASNMVTKPEFETRLSQVTNYLLQKIYSTANSGGGASYSAPALPRPVQLMNVINHLPSGVDIASPSITGGSWSDANITSGSGSFGSLSSNTFATGDATINGTLNVFAINQTGTATSTFARGIQLSGGCIAMPDGTCLGTSNVTNLDSLSDVAITAGAYGDFLMFDGTNWVDTATSTIFKVSKHISDSLSDETGSGSLVFATSPSLTTPNIGAATASSLTLGTLNGPLHSNEGIVSATTSIGVVYGGTGLTSAPSYGQVLLGNASSGYTLTATSSLGFIGSNYRDWTLTTNIYNQSSLTSTTTQNLLVSGTGTSTFAGGLEAWRSIAAPYFHATGTAATSTLAGGLTVDGTSLVVDYSSGNVGIGTTSPQANLHIQSSGWAGMRIQSTSANDGSFIDFFDSNSKKEGSFVFDQDFPALVFRAYSSAAGGTGNASLRFETNSLPRMAINTAGNVGVGTTSPNWKLSVAGDGSFDDFVRASYFTATSTTATSTFSGGLDLASINGNGLNFGTNTNFYQNNQPFLISSTTGAGNLSIGYQSASGLNTNGGLYNLYLGYQAGQNATSSNYNTGLGYQALKNVVKGTGSEGLYNTAVGYRSLYANTTGYQNTANGYGSLYVNTTGYSNTANGSDALYFNTTGNQNTANGYGSLYANTTGNQNTANGYASLYANTTGNQNTANGYRSLRYQTTGSQNTVIGYQAGSGSVNFSDTNSVIDTKMNFFGMYASRDGSVASTTALTNSTAIGYNAKVGASNAMVLGGIGADAVSVVIGTTSPFAKLSILNTYGSQTPLFEVASSTSAAYATSSLFRIDANGNVGVGTTNPDTLLTVKGSASTDSATISSTELTDATGWTSTNWTGDYSVGFTHTTGNTSNLSRAVTITNGSLYQVSFTVTDRTAGNFTVALGYATSTRTFGDSNATFTFGPKATASTGDLTFIPSSTFDGKISSISVKQITNTSSAIYSLKDSTGSTGTEIRQTLSSLGNTFFGLGSGRYNTTGSYNVANGYQSLYFNTTGLYNVAYGHQSLYSNTTGNNNVANGFQSLYSNTTGLYNVAYGHQSLYSNTTGNNNVANGFQSLYSNTTGTNNVANGLQSLYSNTTGNSNVANGREAGRYISDGVTANQTSSNSIYLGYLTKALANGDTNEVVIGDSATGNGSNSITLGNTSITKTIINGNLGLGSTSPFAKLVVAGGDIHVGGIITSTSTATSTFSGGLNVFAINQTGTATSTFAGGLEAWRSIAAPYFHATGTAATSTLAGGLTVDGTTLVVDYSSGKVGIGTTNLDRTLKVSGDFGVTGDAVANGGLYAGGAGGIYISGSNRNNVIWAGISEALNLGGNRTTQVTISSSGNLGVGSTSPYAKLSVHAYNGGTNTTLFSIASSTASATTTHFVVDNQGRVGIGASSSAARLYVYGTTEDSSTLTLDRSASNYGATLKFSEGGVTSWVIKQDIDGGNTGSLQIGTSDYTGSEKVTIKTTGNLGLGSTSPFALLSVNPNALGLGVPEFVVGSSTATHFIVDGSGNVGVGTTSPYAKLSVVGEVAAKNFTATSTTATSTFAGGLDVGGGALQYDFSSGITSVTSLNLGALSFDTDAGMVSWVDMPVTSSATAGTVESYTAQIDGTPLLTVYSQSDGVGGTQNGRVGIGTTSPSATLTVWSATTTAPVFNVTNTASSTLFAITNTGRIGIGSTSPFALLSVNPNALGSGVPEFVVGSSTATHFIVDSSGNVGVGTTSPWRTLSIVGTIAFNGLTTSGTGNAVCITSGKDITDAGGGTCTPSSIRFKENVATLTPGEALDTLSKLNVVSFDYKKEYTSERENSAAIGLIAEEVELVDPRLVDYDYNGVPLTLHFERITGLTVQAIQELNLNLQTLSSTTATTTPESRSFTASFFSSMFDRIEKWLADATNGINKLFAKELHTDTLCVSDGNTETCVTKAQLDNLLAGTAASQTGSSGSNQSGNSSSENNGSGGQNVSDTTAPVILIQGNNPAEITVGSSYADLGAVITDDTDENPTTYTYVDGATTTSVSIDTSVAGTHTITYTATDDAGNTRTAERTVIVTDGEASRPAPEPTPQPEPDTTIPVITLIGSDSVIVTEGDTYTDEGATAEDDVDGDISSSIVTVNPVDTNVPGNYAVTYNVSDTADNQAAEVVRNVVVEALVQPEEPVATLTTP